MGVGHQPIGGDDGGGGGGAETDDIGATNGLLYGGDGVRVWVLRGQLLGLGDAVGCDADLVEVAHAGEHLQVRLTLHSGADDGENGRVFAGEQACGEGGGGGGSEGSDVGAVHDADGDAGLGIEEADEGVVAGEAEGGVAVEEGDELDRDLAAGPVGGHGEQYTSVGDGQFAALGRGDAAVAECAEFVGQRAQKRVGVQQALDIALAEHQDLHIVLLLIACCDREAWLSRAV